MGHQGDHDVRGLQESGQGLALGLRAIGISEPVYLRVVVRHLAALAAQERDHVGCRRIA